MLGHLHHFVTGERSGEFDRGLVQRVKGLQRVLAQRSVLQTAQLLRVLQTLDAAGVQAMPFKGPLWAELLYGDITLRSSSDLDLLVAYDQVAAAREALLHGGFADATAFNARISRRRRGGLGQIALRAVDAGTVAEVHWRSRWG